MIKTTMLLVLIAIVINSIGLLGIKLHYKRDKDIIRRFKVTIGRRIKAEHIVRVIKIGVLGLLEVILYINRDYELFNASAREILNSWIGLVAVILMFIACIFDIISGWFFERRMYLKAKVITRFEGVVADTIRIRDRIDRIVKVADEEIEVADEERDKNVEIDGIQDVEDDGNNRIKDEEDSIGCKDITVNNIGKNNNDAYVDTKDSTKVKGTEKGNANRGTLKLNDAILEKLIDMADLLSRRIDESKKQIINAEKYEYTIQDEKEIIERIETSIRDMAEVNREADEYIDNLDNIE